MVETSTCVAISKIYLVHANYCNEAHIYNVHHIEGGLLV